MPVVDISTNGTDKLLRLGAAIKAAGGKELQKELQQAGRRAGRPLLRSARQGALAILPYRGGLADRVAHGSFTSTVSTAGGRVDLRINAGRGRQQFSQMDEGFVRRPTYGHKPWVRQQIRPGWFTKPLTLDAPKQKKEFEKAVDTVAAKLEAAGG
jgi:hypothetical protein